MTLVEAVLALGIGIGGGFAFLYGTEELRTRGQLNAERQRYEAELRSVETAREAERMRLELAEKERAEKARAAQLAAEEAERARQAEVAAAQAAAARAAADALPAFGILTIKALGTDVVVDSGSERKEGKVVELAFDQAPGKIKVKAGKFNLVLSPKPAGKNLGLDVSVSPLAIIKADGIAKGTSASGLAVGRGAFKLDFSSPASGDLNLILQYRK